MIVRIFSIILSVIISISAQTVDDNTNEVKTCVTQDGIDGECVPYYLCQNGKIITDGKDIIDTRTVGGCIDYFEECCVPEEVHTKQESQTVKRNASYVPECGMRNEEGVLLEGLSDVTNGESQYGEFPWMTAILQKELIAQSFEKAYRCGGSLIDKNVVLTAAHWVKGKSPNDLIVRLGEWDTQANYELFPHSDYEVDKIVIHEKFYSAGLHNDVALLFLKTDVKFTETVDKICLPSQDQPIDLTRCFATGWGKARFEKEENEKESAKFPKILKKIELPTVQHDDCQHKLRKTRLGRRFILDTSFMCAGGEEGIDTCRGDGGSPLVCPAAGVQNKYYQVGIVAWGIGCGAKDVPGVYVNVAKFSTWIDEQIALYAFNV